MIRTCINQGNIPISKEFDEESVLRELVAISVVPAFRFEGS